MENNQPQNKIDLFTDFLTVHNTTIIAIIMAITAMTSQHYSQQEEDVHERQEEFDDMQANLESIRLEFGPNSSQYQAALEAYWQDEQELLEEALESMDSDMEDFDFESFDNQQDPSVQEGRIPQDVAPPEEGGQDGYTPQDGGQADYGQQDAAPADYNQTDGAQPVDSQQPDGADQGGDTQQGDAQPATAQQGDRSQADWDKMEGRFDAVADVADQRSDLADFTAILLQVSVLLSSAGASAKNKLLMYGASFLTLLGVIIEIVIAAFI